MQTRLAGTAWFPADTILSVSKAKDARNPHAFVVAIGGPEVIGAVRFGLKIWQTDQRAMAAIKAFVAPVRLTRGPAAGMQAFVPTAELSEIYADKVFALAARPYLKPRDVFDLHWLAHHNGIPECAGDAMRVRLATYPNETPSAWLRKAAARAQELRSSIPAISSDLKRWLPSSWPLDESSVMAMVGTSIAALERGICLMQEIAENTSFDNSENPL